MRVYVLLSCTAEKLFMEFQTLLSLGKCRRVYFTLPSPQCPEDVWPTYKDGLCWSFSGLYGRGNTTSEGLETWYTFTLWTNFKLGV